MNTETQVCVHEPCACMVQSAIGTDGYCSPYCKTHEIDEEEGSCGCGHPACDAN